MRALVPRPTYIDTYIHTYIHAYIHTCIHTYMHTYIHTDNGLVKSFYYVSTERSISINIINCDVFSLNVVVSAHFWK